MVEAGPQIPQLVGVLALCMQVQTCNAQSPRASGHSQHLPQSSRVWTHAWTHAGSGQLPATTCLLAAHELPADSKNWEHGSRMIDAGVPCCFGLGVGGQSQLFWSLLRICGSFPGLAGCAGLAWLPRGLGNCLVTVLVNQLQ